MGLFDTFKTKPSLSELEEETEYLKSKRELLEERATIRQLEERLGKGSWRTFSSNGKRSGLNFESVRNWLKTH